MTFITVQFDYPQNKATYKILYEALKKSIETNCPTANLHSICIPAPSNPRAWKGATSNTIKLKLWIDALKEIDDTEFIFIDCDMIVEKDMSHVFKKDFDIAYTIRESRYPINGGVVFVKNNERSIKFIERWRDVNDRMYIDKKFHETWRAKYAGINQAAFGYMIEKENRDIKLITVPCMKYNCTDEGWKHITEDTHAIHYKGVLRATVLGKRLVNERTKKAAAIWNKYGDASKSVTFLPPQRRPRRLHPLTKNQTRGRR